MNDYFRTLNNQKNNKILKKPKALWKQKKVIIPGSIFVGGGLGYVLYRSQTTTKQLLTEMEDIKQIINLQTNKDTKQYKTELQKESQNKERYLITAEIPIVLPEDEQKKEPIEKNLVPLDFQDKSLEEPIVKKEELLNQEKSIEELIAIEQQTTENLKTIDPEEIENNSLLPKSFILTENNMDEFIAKIKTHQSLLDQLTINVAISHININILHKIFNTLTNELRDPSYICIIHNLLKTLIEQCEKIDFMNNDGQYIADIINYLDKQNNEEIIDSLFTKITMKEGQEILILQSLTLKLNSHKQLKIFIEHCKTFHWQSSYGENIVAIIIDIKKKESTPNNNIIDLLLSKIKFSEQDQLLTLNNIINGFKTQDPIDIMDQIVKKLIEQWEKIHLNTSDINIFINIIKNITDKNDEIIKEFISKITLAQGQEIIILENIIKQLKDVNYSDKILEILIKKFPPKINRQHISNISHIIINIKKIIIQKDQSMKIIQQLLLQWKFSDQYALIIINLFMQCFSKEKHMVILCEILDILIKNFQNIHITDQTNILNLFDTIIQIKKIITTEESLTIIKLLISKLKFTETNQLEILYYFIDQLIKSLYDRKYMDRFDEILTILMENVKNLHINNDTNIFYLQTIIIHIQSTITKKENLITIIKQLLLKCNFSEKYKIQTLNIILNPFIKDDNPHIFSQILEILIDIFKNFPLATDEDVLYLFDIIPKIINKNDSIIKQFASNITLAQGQELSLLSNITYSLQNVYSANVILEELMKKCGSINITMTNQDYIIKIIKNIKKIPENKGDIIIINFLFQLNFNKDLNKPLILNNIIDELFTLKVNINDRILIQLIEKFGEITINLLFHKKFIVKIINNINFIDIDNKINIIKTLLDALIIKDKKNQLSILSDIIVELTKFRVPFNPYDDFSENNIRIGTDIIPFIRKNQITLDEISFLLPLLKDKNRRYQHYLYQQLKYYTKILEIELKQINNSQDKK